MRREVDEEPTGAVESRRAVLTRRALIAGGAAAGAVVAATPWGRSAGPVRRSLGAPGANAAGSGAAGSSTTVPGPPVVRRAAWGADESRRGAIEFDPIVEKLVMHHTGIDDGSGDWLAQVRDIYEFETASGYRDIAYHFLVDPNGTVYEGRWARDYPAGVDPDGQDARGWSVRGGHARGSNPRTIGIVLLGDYTTSEPSEAALASIVSVLAWKCARWGIDPEGESPYRRASGEQLLPNVLAHGLVRATECPGPNLDRVLPALRAATAAVLSRASGSPSGS